MAVTLGLLRPRVQRRVSAHDTDSMLTPAVLDDFINIAIEQVTLEDDWDYLFQTTTFPTVIGQKNYPMPADWRKTDALVDKIDGAHIDQRTMQEVDAYTVNGISRTYAVSQGQIWLGPAPQDIRTIQHRYLRKENQLFGDDDPLLMPSGIGFEDGIVWYAAYLALIFQREDQRSSEHLQAYKDWLKRARNNRVRTREPMRIRVRPGSMI